MHPEYQQLRREVELRRRLRGRFAIHIGLKARKVETMRSPVETAEEILFNLPPNIASSRQRTRSRARCG
jgi:hypothetical protein